MQIKHSLMVVSGLALGLAACGGEPAVDPGRGSMTLFVDARVDNEGGNAFFDVDVRRNGVAVNDAIVVFASDLGDYTVALELGQNGIYRGGQPGWADSYRVRVTAGEDWLTAAVPSPDPAILTAPDPTVAFDPQAATDGLIDIRWSGTRGQLVRVETSEFGWEGGDAGSLQVAAQSFTDVSDTIAIRRTNSVNMVGGVVGSELRVRVETETDIIIINPFNL